MAKIRNITGEDRIVPALGGLVFKDQVVDVPDGDVFGFTQQVDAWEAVDKAAKDAHAVAEKARDGRLVAERERNTVGVVPARSEADAAGPNAKGGE